ncbi:MAG TPA: hypothetical protein VFK85_04970 [Anaeromyxobacteraceae bacterium]|nr:hypothetical protein [Anaeromyxobacteraceae bacterium]
MTDPADLLDLQRLAELARRRAADARTLASDRRSRASCALAARQMARAQALIDSACWLDAAAEVEDRRAVQLDAHRTSLAARASGAVSAAGVGR